MRSMEEYEKYKISNVSTLEENRSLVRTPHLVGHSNLASTEEPENLLLTYAQNVESYYGLAMSMSNT